MQARQIFYSSDFVKQLRKLPDVVQKIAIKKELIFRDNPIHPSLRFHALTGRLKGLFSISLTLNYRMIFKRKPNGDIIFISIGKHDIYQNL